MANRVTVPTTNFEALSPPWSLASLDADFLALQGALNDSSLGYVVTGTDTGTANAYVIATPSFGMPSAYQTGMTVAFVPANTNTSSASTINVGGLGVQPIQIGATFNPFAATIVAGCVCVMTYVGTAFLLVSNGTFPYTAFFTNPGATVAIGSARIASAVNLTINWTSVQTTGIQLTNLRDGTPVAITLINNTASVCGFRVNGTDPFGGTLSCYATFPTSVAGAVPVVLSGGGTQNVSAGNALTLVGMSNNLSLYFNT